MAKKEEPEKAPNHERWLLTYADMITLLLTFFIVLYALSMVDAKKMARLAESLRTAFNVSKSTGASQQLIEMNGQVIPLPAPSVVSDENSPASSPQQEKLKLSETEDSLNDYSSKQGLLAELAVEMEEKGLVLRLSEAFLFESGRAEIKPTAIPKLVSIGKLLNKTTNYLRVEGHTDNIPIHSGQYRSNWQLSAERATRLTEALVEIAHVSAERFSAMGYGEHRPLASNATEKGRTKNRRVDIVILKNKYGGTEEDRHED